MPTAIDICLAEGGHLTAIRSEEEQLFINSKSKDICLESSFYKPNDVKFYI